ncbi:gas vesicle accessory protein GvpU [Paraburkholderia sacchari]|uniref:gas vesicle accessory protein GvpU n=1 Tax=Paraburkholderia sacchari TaxID=159450 RepID=UPI003D997C25
MAEEQQQQEIEQPNEPMMKEPELDWYLQSLVNMANTTGLSMGITIVLGGTVVSGTLIGGKTYFDTFAQNFVDAWPDLAQESRDPLRETLAKPGEHYGNGYDEAGTSFIHLKDATIRTPSGYMPTSTGLLWRGRLSEVSGFSLGSFS